MKDLVEIIKNNPGCVAEIDNDYWVLYKESPWNNPYEEIDFDKWNEWYNANILARSEEIKPLGDGGYGTGPCYGGDILQALAIIVGIKVQSV